MDDSNTLTPILTICCAPHHFWPPPYHYYNYAYGVKNKKQSIQNFSPSTMQAPKNQQSRAQPYFESIVQPGKKYDCLICKKDTGAFTFILALNSIYCIPCFARQKKWPANYHVINKLEFTVLEDNWTAIQEIFMFQGFEKHGFGNWNQIADYIETNKTKEDVERHYTEFFLSSPNFIPDEGRLLSRRSSTSKLPKTKHFKNNRQTLTSKRIQSINMQKSIKKNSTVEIVGYMPLRNDYQFEYDNEAELLLAEMEFTDEDTQEQVELKFKMIQIYNKRLTERNKKKDFVLSRGILDLEKQIQQQKSLPKVEKEIYNMMKIFSRFHTASDHEQLVRGIIREKQLRQKIEQYKQLHRRGYRTIAEVEQQIERKNETKTKKKSSNEYNFANSSIDSARNNRRANQNGSSLDQSIKKPSVYFSSQELELLRANKLSSISYMMIKETLLREYAKLGTIDRDHALSMFAVQKFIVNNVIDYLESSEEIVCTQ